MKRLVNLVSAVTLLSLLCAVVAYGGFGGGGGGTPNLLGHSFVQSSGLPRAIATANDVDAFNAALLRTLPIYEDGVLASHGGGIIEVHRGVYYFPTEMSFVGPVTLRGQGRSNVGSWTGGTVLYATYTANTAGHTGFTFTGSAITVENISFRADQTSATNSLPGTLIRVANARYMTFRNCDFYLNRVYGPPDTTDNIYAAVVVENTLDGRSTTHITFEDCNFFCPRRKVDGTGGVGFGLLVRNSGIEDEEQNPSFVTDVVFIRCTWANSASGSRAILISGENSPLGRGPADNISFTDCHVGGRSGIEFCSTSRNKFRGTIDLNPALGDTAVFHTLASADNLIEGIVDGYEFDERSVASTRLQVFDLANNAGPFLRGVQFQSYDTGEMPTDQLGADVSFGAVVFDSTVSRLRYYDKDSATWKQIKNEDDP